MHKIKVNYNEENIDLKALNIFNEIKYICDLLLCSNCKQYDHDVYGVEIGENSIHNLLVLLLKIDFINTWKLDIFNKNNQDLSMDCVFKILNIILQHSEKLLFDYLETKKYFFVQKMIFGSESEYFQRNMNTNRYEIVLIIPLLKFIYEKINIDIESVWSIEQLARLLRKLIVPATMFGSKTIKTFIRENGHEIVIKLVKYLLKIYDSQFIYCMISFCIDLLVVIIKYSNDIIRKQCFNCMIDILSHNKLMEYMKCSDSNQRQRLSEDPKSTFKNILSIPCVNIINKTILFLNDKKGDVQDWYHNRSLKWIIRYYDESVTHITQQDIMNLANIILYASDNIRYNINFKECKNIMNLIIDSLKIQYIGINSLYSSNKYWYNYGRKKRRKEISINTNDGKLFYESLIFIEKFGKSYSVLDEKFKAKLLRIYYYKEKYNANVVDKVIILLNKCYKMDVTAIGK